MKTFNPYLKLQSANHTCESALLVQIRSAVESLRSDWKTLGKDPLKAAVTYFADEHGLSCHLLCWLAYWYESDPAAKQLQLLDAFLVLLENAIAGSIPDAEAHRNAAQLLLADESCLEEAAMMFRVCASASLKGTDPRHLAQWNNESSPSVSVERSIWTAASPKPASQPSLFDVPGPSSIRPVDSPGTAKPEILPADQSCPAAATQHSGQNPPMLSRSQNEVLATMRTMLAVFRSGSPSLAGITPRFHPLLVGPTGAGKTFLAGELEGFLRLQRTARTVAGISPRKHPLITGPSGVGKTFLVRLLAAKNRLAFMDFNVSNWLVNGAYQKPHTEQVLADFVKRNDRGIVFIDEVDKIHGNQDWTKHVQQEVFAVLDGRMNTFPAWNETLRKKFVSQFLIVGAGTWQDMQPARAKEIGFGAVRSVKRGGGMEVDTMDHPPAEFLSIADDSTPPGQFSLMDLSAQSSIPEELLFSFNSRVVRIDAMARDEMREQIELIYKDLELVLPAHREFASVLDEAMDSGRQHRWLEALVSRLLIENSESTSGLFSEADSGSSGMRF